MYPAYVEAHKSLFINGDVETESINEEKISGVVLLEGRDLTIEDMVDKACGAIFDQVKSGKTAKDFEKP